MEGVALGPYDSFFLQRGLTGGTGATGYGCTTHFTDSSVGL
jgi:hypothetical protein